MAKPSLYRDGGQDGGKDGPRLLAQKCGGCGRVMFPRQPYGCEVCGAPGARMMAIELAPEGTLNSFAQVHRHAGKDVETPFVVGEICLDSGPFVRATMTASTAQGLRIGQRVAGVLVAARSGEEDVRELRFAVLQ